MTDDDEDLERVLGPDPPWLPLLDPINREWRAAQILKGRNPDPYIEKQLREAGVWPPHPGAGHA